MTYEEDHRRKIQEERRLVRERHVEESLSIWEKQILPDWKTAVRTESLRKVWWNGIPPKLRGFVWENAIGNALALSKGRGHSIVASHPNKLIKDVRRQLSSLLSTSVASFNFWEVSYYNIAFDR